MFFCFIFGYSYTHTSSCAFLFLAAPVLHTFLPKKLLMLLRALPSMCSRKVNSLVGHLRNNYIHHELLIPKFTLPLSCAISSNQGHKNEKTSVRHLLKRCDAWRCVWEHFDPLEGAMSPDLIKKWVHFAYNYSCLGCFWRGPHAAFIFNSLPSLPSSQPPLLLV